MARPGWAGKVKLPEKYGPWAVIAGASQGLGEAWAREAARRGFHVVLVARRGPLLRKLAAEIASTYGVATKVVVQDLEKPGADERILSAALGLDVGLVVYNAAKSLIGPFLDQPLASHRGELAVNCAAPLGLVWHFGRLMKKKGRGGIILMSSLSCGQGSPLVAHYAATKAWNLILAEGLWHEWRPHGVDVLACVAGTVDTPAYRQSRPAADMKPMEPRRVAREGMASLGKRPSVIAGFGNKLSGFAMRRLLPRRLAIGIIGGALKKMYADGPRGKRGASCCG
ncbi:MAG: SDR family NAD(P)-dependent oxidoreductase [Spirochaetes bacterium]|nr:SDR family NAD(P)-dependent oxidoreductase [Spirochaetota bacterium]